VGELKRSPDPLAAIWGLHLKEGEGKGRGEKGGKEVERCKGRKGMGAGKENGKEERGEDRGKGTRLPVCPPLAYFWLRPVPYIGLRVLLMKRSCLPSCFFYL